MTIATRHEVRVDRTKPLADDPGTGHNRWHPDIPPLLWCNPDEEVMLEARDAFDGQFPGGVSLDVVDVPNMLVTAFLPEDIFIDE